MALLGVGCIFFGAQVVVDYMRYRRAIEPRFDRADEAKQELRSRIAAAEVELAEARAELDPSREQVQQLEREYNELHEQVKEEADRQRGGSRLPADE